MGKQDEKLEDAIDEISEDLSDLIDEKLTTYEKSIVEKAYNEFQEVNYVIIQTLIIDDIIKEIDKLCDDYQKNKYSDYELNDKINNIMTKINKIETNYQKKEVLPKPRTAEQRFVHMCDFLASRKFLDIKFENNEIVE